MDRTGMDFFNKDVELDEFENNESIDGFLQLFHEIDPDQILFCDLIKKP